MILLILLAAGAAIWTLQLPHIDRLLLIQGYGIGVVTSFVGMFCVSFERDRTVRRLRRRLREGEEVRNG